MLWRPPETFVFEENEVCRWWGILGNYVPLPSLDILLDPHKLYNWSWGGEWQKEPHACVCPSNGLGVCKPDLQAVTGFSWEATRTIGIRPTSSCMPIVWIIATFKEGRIQSLRVSFSFEDPFPEFLEAKEGLPDSS